MKKEELFEALGDLDIELIEEASQVKQKQHYFSVRKGLVIVACICFTLLIGVAFLGLPGDSSKDYQVIAAELGAAEMPFGATSPQIVYADEEKVIMYDYIGIWVFDLNEQALVGYCDFRPINMTQIQGSPCVFVQASRDGSKVRFYMNDGSVNYLYDVEKDSYKKVDNYDEGDFFDYYSYKKYDVTDSKGLSIYSDTYTMVNTEDDCYVSYTLDNVDGEHPYEIYGLHYSDVKLLVERQGKITEYYIFQ